MLHGHQTNILVYQASRSNGFFRHSTQSKRPDTTQEIDTGTRWVLTHREGDYPVDELARQTAIAIHDVARDEVLRGALPEGRDAWSSNGWRRKVNVN